MSKVSKGVIEIKCYYDELVPFNQLYSIQENLKESKGATQLKESIVNNGVTFPSFVWLDPSDLRYKIVDGVHRLKACKSLVEEGYSLEGMPCIFVICKSYKEAKEFVLRSTSDFARTTKERVKDYVEDAGLEYEELNNEVSPKDFGFIKDLMIEPDDAGDLKVGKGRSNPILEIEADDMEYVMLQIVFDTKEQLDKFWNSMIKIRSMQRQYKNEDYKDVLFDLLSKECQEIGGKV